MLEHRSDDNEETFRKRFQSYLDNTSPIIDYYKSKSLLIEIDAMKGIDNILDCILNEAKND